MGQQEVLDILCASQIPMTAREIRDAGWPEGKRERLTSISYALSRLEHWGYVRRVGKQVMKNEYNQIIESTLWEVVR